MTCKKKKKKGICIISLKEWLVRRHMFFSERIHDGQRTTVQQRGQNHHSRAMVSSSIRMSRAIATKVPSDWNAK